MSLKGLLNKKVDIIRISRTADNVGSQVESENVLHSNLPCRINWVRGSERIILGKTTYYRDAKLYCSYQAGITVQDRVLFNGVYYDIVNVSDVDSLGKYLIIEIKLMERQ